MISKEIQAALKTIIDEFDKEDQSVRERQIRVWKKLEYYWAGFQRIWWDSVAHDWRIWNTDLQNGLGWNEAEYYDKPINVFRAFLESVIAALSATVPGLKCIPDDADNANDLTTARGGDKITELVYKHNNAPLLWIKALYTYCTQGMIAAYNYTCEDKKYGTVPFPNYEDEEQEVEVKVCPLCGTVIQEPELSYAEFLDNQERAEFDPNDDDTVAHAELNKIESSPTQVFCPRCLAQVDPEFRKDKIVVTRITGITDQPKSRQIIEVAGGLWVKIPNYARTQAECPYLDYDYEVHYTQVLKKWPHLRKMVDSDSSRITKSAGFNVYERWGRLSTQYLGEYPMNTPTVRNWWLRPESYEILEDEDIRKQLYKKFPDGVRCVFVNEQFAEAENEALDDHWTITYNPLSEYIHFDPLGLLVTSIQDITADLVSLTLQTIEHGVGQTFADPSVLNFEQYRNSEIAPGSIIPAMPKGGKALGDGFYELSTAQLSNEVLPFANKIQELGEFTSGAMPSIFGGAMPSSARTASQMSQSRSQALQRLQTPWKMINYWWKDIFSKVIPAYMKSMLEDERLVRKEYGVFINDVIKRAELDGKIGSIELESSDEIPQSWAQTRDTLMNLLNSNNQEIFAALSSPDNLEILSEALGLDDFNIPGRKDREREYQIIQQLIQSGPIPGPMGQLVSTIMPEQFVDNNNIGADICRTWLVSEAGQICKTENMPGYQNVVARLKGHIDLMVQNQPVNPQPEEAKGKAPSAKPTKLNPVT